MADEFVSDPSNHFSIGQSVRAQVLEVIKSYTWSFLVFMSSTWH